MFISIYTWLLRVFINLVKDVCHDRRTIFGKKDSISRLFPNRTLVLMIASIRNLKRWHGWIRWFLSIVPIALVMADWRDFIVLLAELPAPYCVSHIVFEVNDVFQYYSMIMSMWTPFSGFLTYTLHIRHWWYFRSTHMMPCFEVMDAETMQVSDSIKMTLKMTWSEFF